MVSVGRLSANGTLTISCRLSGIFSPEEFLTSCLQNASKQISKAYELAFNKPISPDQQKVFEKLYQTALTKYKQDRFRIEQITGDKNADVSSAALMMVTTAIINTDEFLTKN